MWRTYLADTMTGAVGAPIELPSFRWSLSVSDSSLQTTRDKGTGELDATGLQVPWTAVPAQTPEGRAQALASMRRSIVLCWEGADGREVPVVAGAIGSRTDTWTDTSFDLLSPMSILSSRYVVREGAVGAGTYKPDHSKTAKGTSYTSDLGGFRGYMKWQRTENPAGVTLKVSCGIQVTSDSKVDKDGLWATVQIGSDSKEWAIGGIHQSGVSEIWLRDGGAYKQRGGAQDSLKASCKIWVPTGETYKSNTDGHKKGDPKYQTATATVSATVKTRDDYEAGYTKWSQQAHGSVTMDDIMLTGSWRSIASQCVYMCTSAKPGGQLPIDLPYLHEGGRHSLTLKGSDLSSNACSDVLKSIADTAGGPDLQFRPYLVNSGTGFRFRLLGGSDDEPCLEQDGLVHTLTAYPQGGTVGNLSIAHLGPTMRVYGTGAGSDDTQLQCVAEDLSLVREGDPWPLSESVKSWSSDEDAAQLQDDASAALESVSSPLMQLQCETWLGDPHGIQPGDVWPGQLMDVCIEGHPCFPDGTYRMRLMQMEGDATEKCTLTFDVMEDVWR